MSQSNVKNYTDDQIIKKIESLPTFAGWKKGKYLVAIRSNEDAFDKFDDKFYSYEVLADNQTPIFAMVISGTTNPGAQGLKNFEKYGNTRCAVLMPDIIVYDSHKYGLHKGKTPAYRQNKPWPYNFDDNKNEISGDGDKVVEGEIIFANIHPAGEASENIGGWSIACMVMNIEKQWDKWMDWMDKEEFVSLTILKEW